jgi:hypothetical protein
MDALQVINQLNATGPAQLSLPDLPNKILPPLLDVDGDGHVLPHDALFVINYLNRMNNSGEGEGDETSGGNPPAWLLTWPVMTSAFAPGETAVSDHLHTDGLERYPAVGYPYLVWPAAREQLADHFAARLPAARATGQADLTDDLRVLGDPDSGGPLDCEAPPEGRFAFWA